jgi:hypothetical protein
MNKSEFMNAVFMYRTYEALVSAVEHTAGTNNIGIYRSYDDERITFAIDSYYRPDNCIHLYKDGSMYHFDHSNLAARQEQTPVIKAHSEMLYSQDAQRVIFDMTKNYKGVYRMDDTMETVQDFDDYAYSDRIESVITHSYNPATGRYSHTHPRRERYSGLVHANID